MKTMKVVNFCKGYNKPISIDFNLEGVGIVGLVGIIYYDGVFYISEYNNKEKTIVINQLECSELPMELVNLIDFLFENGKYEIEFI